VNTGVDVPATPAHLREAGWFEIAHRLLAPSDSVHTDLCEPTTFELPDLVATLINDHMRCSSLKSRRETTLEHVRRFNKMVVDGDDRVSHLSWRGISK
jgi:hypothetical protein